MFETKGIAMIQMLRLCVFFIFCLFITQAEAQWRNIKKPETRGIQSNQVLENNGFIFLVGADGLYRTKDLNDQWKLVYNGNLGVGVDDGKTLGTSGKLLTLNKRVFSKDNGNTWDTLSIPDSINYPGSGIIKVADGKFFYKTTKGAHAKESFLYVSDDFGKTWKRDSNPKLEHTELKMLKGEHLIGIKDSQSIFITKTGESFQSIPTTNLDNPSEMIYMGDSANLFAKPRVSFDSPYVKWYDPNAKKWKSILSNLNETAVAINNFSVHRDTVLLTIAKRNPPEFQYLWSPDKGQTWNRIQFSDIPLDIALSISSTADGKWMASTLTGPYFSSDQGNTWVRNAKGIYKKAFRVEKFKGELLPSSIGEVFTYNPDNESFTKKQYPFDETLNRGFFESRGLLYSLSVDYFTREYHLAHKNGLDNPWQKVDLPLKDSGYLSSIRFSGRHLVKNQMINTNSQFKSVMHFSADTGNTWDTLSYDRDVLALKQYKSGLLLVLEKSRSEQKRQFFYTSNNAGSWQPINEAFGSANIQKILTHDGQITVIPRLTSSGKPDSVYYYHGKEWSPFAMQGLDDSEGIVSIERYDGDKLIMLTYSGIKISGDQGKTWQHALDLPFFRNANSVAFEGNKVLLGTGRGLYQTDQFSNLEPEVNQSGKVHIYPNPVISNNITLTINAQQSAEWHGRIISAQGQIVKDFKWDQGIADDELQIALPQHISSGIYQLVLNGRERQYSGKIIVR